MFIFLPDAKARAKPTCSLHTVFRGVPVTVDFSYGFANVERELGEKLIELRRVTRSYRDWAADLIISGARARRAA